MVRKGWSWPVPWNQGSFLPGCLGRIVKAPSKGSRVLAFFFLEQRFLLGAGQDPSCLKDALPFLPSLLLSFCLSLLSTKQLLNTHRVPSPVLGAVEATKRAAFEGWVVGI